MTVYSSSLEMLEGLTSSEFDVYIYITQWVLFSIPTGACNFKAVWNVFFGWFRHKFKPQARENLSRGNILPVIQRFLSFFKFFL
jgi:hypothetical protein